MVAIDQTIKQAAFVAATVVHSCITLWFIVLYYRQRARLKNFLKGIEAADPELYKAAMHMTSNP